MRSGPLSTWGLRATHTPGRRVIDGQRERKYGTVSDLAVDQLRGTVFLSNTSFNLLEVWDNTAKTFAANGIAALNSAP